MQDCTGDVPSSSSSDARVCPLLARTNPFGGDDSSRVYRGGNWHSNDASNLRTFERGRSDPMQHPFWVGFRCARSVDPAQGARR
jgi:formylglycine-generating enzyme required for sulfatase activity